MHTDTQDYRNSTEYLSIYVNGVYGDEDCNG